MIKPSDIILHLQIYLPFFTDKFSETVTVTSATSGASNIVSVNAVNHGLSDNANITITQGTIRNSITSVSILDGIATFITQYNHQLITPQLEYDTSEIDMEGFSSDFNGTFTILDTTSQKEFRIETEVTSVPTTLGYFKDNRSAGIKGLQTITLINSDNFEFTSPYYTLPQGDIDNLKIIKATRCYGSADIERAKDIYTKKPTTDTLWLFVIMNDVETSKDRHTLNDTTAGFTSQDLKLLRVSTDFSLVVFFPTQETLSGTEAQELAYGEITTSLISTLYGFGFTDPESAVPYTTVLTGHTPGIYDSSVYSQVYDWTLPSVFAFDSGFSVQVGPIATNLIGINATFDISSDVAAQMSFDIEY